MVPLELHDFSCKKFSSFNYLHIEHQQSIYCDEIFDLKFSKVNIGKVVGYLFMV